MNRKKLVLLFFAIVVGLGSMQLARQMLNKPAPKPVVSNVPAPAPDVEILVAAKNLPAGTLLNDRHLAWKPWPEDDEALDKYFVKGDIKQNDLFGSVVRRGITNGEPLTVGRIVEPGERGFLAAVLDPTMRAVTVPINGITGIAGFVFPGDRVDIILSHEIVLENDAFQQERRATETILTNVRVLAIDQMVNDQATQPKVGSTATLEVTPKQAELIILTRELGQLSLSLRSLQEQGGPETNQAFADAVSAPRQDPFESEEFLELNTAEPLADGLSFVNFRTASDSEKEEPISPADLAAAYRSADEKPYSWDSDVSLLLNQPADKADLVQNVRIVRGNFDNVEQISFEK